ncbi:MAG: Smr/MutS family protein [Myxococcota bacterium]
MSDAEAKTLADLEWDQLAQAVADRCQGPLRDRLELPLAESFEDTARALSESTEAWQLLRRGEPIPLDGLKAVEPSLQHLERDGVLDAEALRDIKLSLRAAATLRRFLSERRSQVPFLDRACAVDPTLEGLEDEIGMSVGDDGLLLDSASVELAHLRQEVGNLRGRIVRKLEELIAKRSAILQDSFYTLREGRYVLPVRADAHEKFHGIVHGSSASGATIFVEPRELVDRGNRLKMAQAELDREERRILAAVSNLVRQYVPQLRAAAEALDHADLRAASARLAVDLDAHFVSLSEHPTISLRGARHPLLALRGLDVVPNDIDLRGGEALVISGPNAGGKTVALKMLGLAALMTRAGLAFPAEEGGVCGFFAPVLAAVGDEQSLERSLSTFSAHLMTLKLVIAHANERVLILLDELAGATDPEAGAALACAITVELVERRAAVAVTTHYEALKALAANRDDMKNASVGFDFERMAPTFQLGMGVPGGSNALNVARRYGIPNEIVDKAERALPDHARSFEALVAELEAAKRLAATEAQRLERERAGLADAETKLAARRKVLEARDAKGLGVEAAKLVEQVRELQARFDAAKRALRERASTEALAAVQTLAGEGSELLSKLDEERTNLEPEPVETTEIDPSSVRAGDRVWVNRLRSVAEVIETEARGKIRVSAGMMKLWVDVSDLRSVKQAEPIGRERRTRAPALTPATRERTVRTRDNTLDVRGMRADEAVAMAVAFLDRMFGAAEPSAFILHGVGSGALREAIHAHLAQDTSYVGDYRQATPEEGGPQLTVVSLK